MAIENPLATIAKVVTAVGASNWALVEFFDYDLLLDGLQFTQGETALTAAYAVIGLSAVATMYYEAMWQGWIEG